jgi:hypothetical protein
LGLDYDAGNLYSVSYFKEDGRKVRRHRIDDLFVEKNWNITGSASDFLKSSLVRGDKIYMLKENVSPSKTFISVYRFK